MALWGDIGKYEGEYIYVAASHHEMDTGVSRGVHGVHKPEGNLKGI